MLLICSFFLEKYELLMNSTAIERKELDSLRAKNDKFSTSIIQHQQNLQTLSVELSSAKQELNKLKNLNLSLTSEKQLLQANEKRLVEQANDLITQKSKLQSFLDSMQSSLLANEKLQSQLKASLNTQLED